MGKIGAGTSFCILAAVIQCAKYLAAAVYLSGNASQSRELFRSGLGYVGRWPDVMSVIALVCGAVFMAWGIIESIRKK